MTSEGAPVREVSAGAVALADLRPDIVAVALVGSYAIGSARVDSDIDLVVLTRQPERMLADDSWFAAFGSDVRLIGARDFGTLQERRLRRPDGLEIEVCVGSLHWAATDPVDPGTATVVVSGMVALVDPEMLLAHLAGAVADAGLAQTERGLLVEQATVVDAAALLALRTGVTRWLLARGIQQWQIVDVSRTDLERQASDGQWHVVRSPRGLIAGLRLMQSDEQFWGRLTPDAFYLHGLVVDRQHAGHAIGERLLTWAEEQARAADRSFLRLDCQESNLFLRNYYASAGYREVGRWQGADDRHGVSVLLQKDLTSRGTPVTSP